MANQAQLVITLDPEGRVQVQGPIDNKLLCYGLMEAARDAIKDFTDQKAKSGIIPSAPMPGPIELRRM